MSCHSSHSNKGSITLSTHLTGMGREDVERTFHDLKKVGRKDPAGAEPPTAEAWQAHLRQSTLLAQDLPDGARARVTGQLAAAADETPDGATYYAQRHLLAECETRVRREQVRATRAATAPGQDEIARLADSGRPAVHPHGVDTEFTDSVIPGISAEDADYYTSHHCEQLAWILHQQTGWPLIAMFADEGSDSDVVSWIHVGVVRPDGQVVDVEGVRAEQDWLDRWDASFVNDGWTARVNDVQAEMGWTADEMTDQDRERASRVAATVLAYATGEQDA